MISRLMLNLRDPRLASRSRDGTAEGSMQAGRSKQVFSTLLAFNTSDSQFVTDENVRSTADARDPDMELTTRKTTQNK